MRQQTEMVVCRPYLHNAFKQVNPKINTFTKNFSFNLQNGREILSEYFDDVQRCDFEDSLSITETQDLIDWLKSTITIASYSENDLNGFYDYFEGIRQKEGAIKFPKKLDCLFLPRYKLYITDLMEEIQMKQYLIYANIY